MKFDVKVDPRLGLDNKHLSQVASLPACVVFSGEFNEDSARKFREDFNGAENAAKAAGQEVLPVVIDSYGGLVHSLLSMVDVIKNCDLKVATIVESKAMSCGAFLFSCGTEGYRFVSPYATVMLHAVSAGNYGNVEEIKNSASETDRLNELAFDILTENCGKSKDYFKNKMYERKMTDWYMTPEECVKHNLANHVGVPTLNVEINMEHSFVFPKVK